MIARLLDRLRPAKLRTAFLALAALLVAAPALAGTPVMLKPDPTDASGHVTLGELFDNAGPARDVVVADRSGPTVVLDAAAVQLLASRYGLDWANSQGLRRIIVHSQSAEAGAWEVLTYARNLAAGEIIQPSDIIWAKAVAEPADAASSVDAVVGLAARRPLREGDPVLVRDITQPIVIKVGDTVLVTYADQGVTLTLQAKAMSNAAAGGTIEVLNIASKKLIEAVATGPGQAVVGPQAIRLKAERNPSQIAFR